MPARATRPTGIAVPNRRVVPTVERGVKLERFRRRAVNPEQVGRENCMLEIRNCAGGILYRPPLSIQQTAYGTYDEHQCYKTQQRTVVCERSSQPRNRTRNRKQFS